MMEPNCPPAGSGAGRAAPGAADGAEPLRQWHVRLALPAHIARITALQRAAIAAVPNGVYDPAAKAAWWRTPAKGLDRLVGAGRYFVVMSADRPLAGAGWEPVPACRTARLRAVFVDPAAAGRGLGASCVARVEAAVRQAGHRRLLVPAALNAVGFYERLGYRGIGWGREAVAPGVLLAYRRMEKRLAPADAARALEAPMPRPHCAVASS